MTRYLTSRLAGMVVVMMLVATIVFFITRLAPGDPAAIMLGDQATAADIAKLRESYGLDKPLPVQYWDYLKSLVSGNLGTSISSFRPVTYELGHRFPATIELALGAMAFAIALGIPLGFMAAKKYGSWFDQTSLVASLLGISIPIFVLGIILKYIFAVRLHWLPSIGREDILAVRPHPTNFYILDAIINADPGALWDAIKHLILPSIALGSIPLAIVMRITRASVLDVQHEDYVRTARAKGLPPGEVDRRHVLRNALLPISTIIGLQTGLLLSGAVLTETVFDWPGVGSWLTTAIANRDYPVLQGGILFLAIVFVLVNLVVDISYAIINPRIRLS